LSEKYKKFVPIIFSSVKTTARSDSAFTETQRRLIHLEEIHMLAATNGETVKDDFEDEWVMKKFRASKLKRISIIAGIQAEWYSFLIVNFLNQFYRSFMNAGGNSGKDFMRTFPHYSNLREFKSKSIR